MAIKIVSFNHYTIVVSKLQESIDFYVNVLGMNILPRPDFDFEGAWLDIGNQQQIHLISDKEMKLTNVGGSRSLHFAYEVEDILVAKAAISAAGVIIVKDIKQRPDGILQMFIQDPDGYYIELTQLKI